MDWSYSIYKLPHKATGIFAEKSKHIQVQLFPEVEIYVSNILSDMDHLACACNQHSKGVRILVFQL